MEDNDVVLAAEDLYNKLNDNCIEVLFDDRIESAGVKFNDADILGIPVRLVVSQRTLKSENAEIKLRKMKEAELVPLTAVMESITNVLQ
jgi:prolyl-tRNA synthetase